MFRSDGQWIKRSNYLLKIPIRENFGDAYQNLYFKRGEINEDSDKTTNVSTIGELVFEDQISSNPEFGDLCEFIGVYSLPMTLYLCVI